MATQEMVRFDAVRIRTDDLARATRQYALLLGCAPPPVDAGTVRFALGRGAVELVHATPAGGQGLRLVETGAEGAEQALRAAHAVRFGGVDVVLDPPRTIADGQIAASTPGGFLAIDHVVVNTPDAERAIRLWRDTLGVRLALDREFPTRGLRMLFFRSAGVTLEIVSAIGGAGDGADLQNGVAYKVDDVARVRERLLAADFDVSPVRDGNKRGTLVATVRNGTEGVPTLLIEALPAGDPRS